MCPDPFDFAVSSRFAVMGQPIRHSLSPQIHTAFGRQCGIALQYEAIEVAAGGLSQAVSHFQALGGRGLNITVPLKREAAQTAQRLSAAAARAGAVNTLLLGDEVVGDNTDGTGLIRDLERQGVALAGSAVLILGAGGAVRGILGPLATAGVALIAVVNRDEAKARALVDEFRDLEGPRLIAAGFDDLPAAEYGLLINATSAGLGGALPPVALLPVGRDTFVYDLLYGPAAAPLKSWARARGLASADGLGMLVEQAAESFYLWHGVRPDAGAVLLSLREQLAASAAKELS